MLLTFEDVWDYNIRQAHERRTLPTIESAAPGDGQVLVPHPGDPHRQPYRDAPPASLNGLADKPWVESIVAEWACEANVSLAGVRSLVMLDTFQVRGELLARLPNLQQLAAADVLPEDLAQLPPALLKRIEFDTEAGAVGVYATSEADIRAVAEAVRDLAARA